MFHKDNPLLAIVELQRKHIEDLEEAVVKLSEENIALRKSMNAKENAYE